MDVTNRLPSPNEPCYPIAEAAEASGTTVDTLRYYERAGVLPPIHRTEGNQRLFSHDDLGWIAFVRRLRATGMSMQTIVSYTTMVRAGEGTVSQRRRMLEDHRSTVAAAITELGEALAALDRKIAHYEAAERGVDLSCAEEPLRHVAGLQ